MIDLSQLRIFPPSKDRSSSKKTNANNKNNNDDDNDNDNEEKNDNEENTNIAKRAIWVLYVDVVALNNDGNVTDAAIIATITALHNLKLPQVALNEQEDQIVVRPDLPPKRALDLAHIPVPLTFAIVDDDRIICDPTDEEEALQNCPFTIVYNEKGQLCCLHKPGGNETSTAFTEDVLKTCMDQAKARAKEINKMIIEQEKQK